MESKDGSGEPEYFRLGYIESIDGKRLKLGVDVALPKDSTLTESNVFIVQGQIIEQREDSFALHVTAER